MSGAGDGQFFDLHAEDARRSASGASGYGGGGGAPQQQWSTQKGYSQPKSLSGANPLPGPGGEQQVVGSPYGTPCAQSCAPPPQPACPQERGSAHFGFHLGWNSLCRRFHESAYCPCAQAWKPCSLLVEFLGTLFLVFSIAAVAACTCGVDDLNGWLLAKIVVGLVAGFTLAYLVSAFGSISGGHFNPHVTAAFWMCGKINSVAALLYWLVQFLGAVVAGALLLIFYDSYHCCLGTPQLQSGITIGQGLGAEIIGTAILVSVILFAVDNAVNAPVAIGFTLGALQLVFLAVSGASFNFWRFLGPAIFSGCFDDWWVYLVGGIVGGLIGWAFYKFCQYLKCWGNKSGGGYGSKY